MSNISTTMEPSVKLLELQVDHINIEINHPNNEHQDDLSLILVDRISEEEREFELNESSDEEMSIYFRTIPTENSLKAIGAVWDFYVFNHNTNKKSRLKSFDQYLELKAISIGQDKMMLPYTTNKGNLSLKIQEKSVVSKVEEIQVTRNGKLDIFGYAMYPEANVSITNMRLSIQHPNGEIKINMQDGDKDELTKQVVANGYKVRSFSLQIELRDYGALFNVAHNSLMKLSYTITDENEEDFTGSTILKLLPYSHIASKEAVIQSNSGKRRVKVDANKKTKNLRIKISSHSLKKRVVSKIKNKLIEIKRHQKTKELYKLAFKWIGKLPADQKLIMFESFLGKQYSCNPRAIYEYLEQNHPTYKMFWSVDKRYAETFRKEGIPHINRFSLKWLFATARAKYWVTNSRMPLWIPKPKNTVYLQTWHGTPLKRLAADMEEVHMPGTNTQKYKKNFHKESRNWDYLISPNGYSTEIFRRAFNFEKEMIESGYPRNDILHNHDNEENIRKLKSKMGIPIEKKVILYAPTWRDDQFYGKGRYKFDLALDLNKLRDELGEEYVIILRMHYLVAENFDLSPYEGFAFDFSLHGDISELYLISDLLITDYSSVFFDFGNLKRPMIFYVYDIENYRDKLRGFYFDFEQEAPGPLVKTTDEVIDRIREDSQINIAEDKRFKQFHEKFCYLESGESAKRVVDRVFLGKDS
ncbi:CDP-glycerol glycerophosphotransferase family protein [Pseudalkalibacillus berkeleyi]|uniref:CDP-glycerol glycerophosphotransferase family protein n=1 Tax=Pseudalkalibacillus berkeleyi TaxID=1069813 RepID=A0ABS9H1A6_9BACL|nr:CDP-glycerol glycerophosphotransferase family protein [Pseudalkalibacillus berkeleyi]MCF6138777.1 CDP-glycerol glycerophosphotransferase family protein [Pseudalkalibacillus berkeleyi]